MSRTPAIALAAITGLTLVLLAGCESESTAPFGLKEVRLLDGPFKEAQDRASLTLLKTYEPDRFLSRPRTAAGLDAKAPPYEGWEVGLTGHSLGHYLSGCSLAWQATGDPEFKRRVDTMVSELALIQKAYGNGFVAGPPNTKEQFEKHISKGDISPKPFELNGVWVPVYAMHKVFAGLRDAYHLTGNRKALTVERGFGLWLYRQLMHLSEADFAKIRSCEQGGIQETLAELYADTGDLRFMDLARRFYDPSLMDLLVQGRDNLCGLHANCQLPKYAGLARIYELTGSTRERKAAEFFWDRVAHHHSYVTGGNSDHEHFGPADRLNDRLTDSTTETCNTYNILRLSSHVFAWEPSSKIADFQERAMLNHSLASQDPSSGKVTYFLSLEMGGSRVYQDPLSLTCCVGSGMEHHFLYPGFIYFHAPGQLYVNQFIASELNWNTTGLTLTQTTDFPREQRSTLSVSCAKPVTFEMLIRRPYWLQGGSIRVNDQVLERPAVTASGYFSIQRTWRSGDRVVIDLPFGLSQQPMPDNPNRVAIFHGPLALAGDLGPADDPAASDANYVPVLLTRDRPMSEWLQPTSDGPSSFKLASAGDPRDVVLRPFYTLYNRRSTVYWDVFPPTLWQAQKAFYRERIGGFKDLESRTLDTVQLGDARSEADHHFQGVNTSVSEDGQRAVRKARSGWFSVDLKVLAKEPVALIISYWGDVSGNDKATFDVLVDGLVVATRNIHWHGKRFIDEPIALDPAMTAGKEKVTVTFRSAPDFQAGPIAGVRIIRRER
jgi:DUF1680 family protein